MDPPSHGFADGIRAFLHRDHARLEGLLDRFQEAPGGPGSPGGPQRWQDFEAAFLGHMTAEERHLMPPFAAQQPGEAAELRAQHYELRRLLAVAGADPRPGSPELEAFVRALRLHARREDLVLYRWADRAERGTVEGVVREIAGRPARVQ
jgi:beta-phosphoglucomutase-like phosphatase (HAD superfamily)